MKGLGPANHNYLDCGIMKIPTLCPSLIVFTPPGEMGCSNMFFLSPQNSLHKHIKQGFKFYQQTAVMNSTNLICSSPTWASTVPTPGAASFYFISMQIKAPRIYRTTRADILSKVKNTSQSIHSHHTRPLCQHHGTEAKNQSSFRALPDTSGHVTQPQLSLQLVQNRNRGS